SASCDRSRKNVRDVNCLEFTEKADPASSDQVFGLRDLLPEYLQPRFHDLRRAALLFGDDLPRVVPDAIDFLVCVSIGADCRPGKAHAGKESTRPRVAEDLCLKFVVG